MASRMNAAFPFAFQPTNTPTVRAWSEDEATIDRARIRSAPRKLLKYRSALSSQSLAAASISISGLLCAASAAALESHDDFGEVVQKLAIEAAAKTYLPKGTILH